PRVDPVVPRGDSVEEPPGLCGSLDDGHHLRTAPSHLKSRAEPAKSISRGDRWREERMAKVEAKRAAARTRTKSSKAYSDRARRSLPGGVTANVKYFDPYPIAMRRARGCRRGDVGGSQNFDYCRDSGPVILGP